jgi:hypothetical protein
LIGWLWVALLCCVPPLAGAQGVQADNFQLTRTEEGVLLNVSLRFDLPVAVEDALLKGVPVVFSAQAETLRQRWYWSDKITARVQRSMRLSYQPLTRRWRLQTHHNTTTPEGTLTQTHESLASAMAAVRSIQRWKVADWSELEPDTRYVLDFRFRIDTHQLPRLFQLGIDNAGDWGLGFSKSMRWTHDGKMDNAR